MSFGAPSVGLTRRGTALAEGLWDSGGTVKRDDVVVLEVMTETLDRAWWRAVRRFGEKRPERRNCGSQPVRRSPEVCARRPVLIGDFCGPAS